MKYVFCVLAIASLFVSCQSAGEKKPETGIATADALSEMKTYYENGMKRLDEMAISEGISQLVAVMAIYDSVSNPSVEVKDLAGKARTELTKIEAGLLLQPSAEWLDANADQKTVVINVAEKAGQQAPAVVLEYNIGGSRAAVSGAPVVFEFVAGKGLLSGGTVTNEYGQAAAQIGRFDEISKENVIRAQVIYRVKGFVYQFQSLKRDFIYRPAGKRATILVYERAPSYVSDDPVIFNKSYEVLKKNEFDFVPYNGKLLGDNFVRVFGGDLESIKALPLSKDAPYLVLVFSDCYDIPHPNPNFAIYFAYAKATLRIIRVADGKILFETVVYADKAHDSYGQGNSEVSARNNVFKRLADLMEAELGKKIREINQALGIDK